MCTTNIFATDEVWQVPGIGHFLPFSKYINLTLRFACGHWWLASCLMDRDMSEELLGLKSRNTDEVTQK